MDFIEESFIEMKDGRQGLIVEVRVNGNTQYDIELENGELMTAFHEEVLKKVERSTK